MAVFFIINVVRTQTLTFLELFVPNILLRAYALLS